MTGLGSYHVLLIGCDQYPPQQNSLSGCVNDIDAVERLLLSNPDVGSDRSRLELTRLAAPRQGATTKSRYAAATRLPTRANIIAALEALAGPQVQQADRVHIHYSGHGGQWQRQDGKGWYECLVTCDDYGLYDHELNALIAAISRRTSDLTVVLDCCHSAGATREIGGIRFATPGNRVSPLAGTAERRGPSGDRSGSRLLQTADPDYLVIAACQADETAQEGIVDGTAHGFLTYSLVKVMGAIAPQQRERVRWADIWARVRDEMSRAAARARRLGQTPWIIGRPERRVFGGPWTRQDAGFQLSANPDHSFTIEAGTVVGVTDGAILGVYGAAPDRFPEVGSPDDLTARIGELKVVRAGRATSVAQEEKSPPSPLPPGSRARVIRPGKSELLRVLVDPGPTGPASVLGQSAMLQLVSDQDEPELRVERTPEGWQLSNNANRAIARLRVDSGAGEAELSQLYGALRAGIESYARYNQVLRLAKSSNDPELDQSMAVVLRDCSDTAVLATIDPKVPDLPDVPRGSSGIYQTDADKPYCVSVSNLYTQTLYFTVFNCTAHGMVEFLGDVGVNSKDTETLWSGAVQRSPFTAAPDDPEVDTVDRIVAIATTRKGVDLRHLEVRESVQHVMDQLTTRSIDQRAKRSRGGPRGSGTLQQPVNTELWTAVIVPLEIRRKRPA
jgi:hypothetical protein